MTSSLLPQPFWFRLAIPCLRMKDLDGADARRGLELPETCRLPQTSKLDGREPWAEVRVAWNPKGLAIVVQAEGKLDGLIADDRPEGSYGFQVWVDTRDTRDVSRATRFCHRFDGTLHKGPGKGALILKVHQRPIARAVADAPLRDSDLLACGVERLKQGWKASLFLPAEVLHGFDADTNRRLGFSYRVTDPDQPDEVLGVGREFPIGENPSLWSTLELRDEP